MEKLEFTIENTKYETICTIDVKDYGKSYICYTDNSLDENKELKTFISAYTFKNDELNITPIEDEKEWEFIEKVFSKKLMAMEE